MKNTLLLLSTCILPFLFLRRILRWTLVFYRSAPDQMKDIKKIKAPVYGFYGENDELINAGIPATEKMMKQAGKTYEYKIYPGAGHAYMRQGDDPEGSEESQEAKEASWERTNQILSSIY